MPHSRIRWKLHHQCTLQRRACAHALNGSASVFDDTADLGSKDTVDEVKGIALQSAVEEVIFGTLMGDSNDQGGDGGVIALDRDGNFAAEMNCPGMYHGWVYEDGEMETRIFWDE